MDVPVEYTHAENHGCEELAAIFRKGTKYTVKKSGPGGLREGSSAYCPAQHVAISLSKAYWQTTLNNLDKGDLIKMLYA